MLYKFGSKTTKKISVNTCYIWIYKNFDKNIVILLNSLHQVALP